jgi:hypothetical protein
MLSPVPARFILPNVRPVHPIASSPDDANLYLLLALTTNTNLKKDFMRQEVPIAMAAKFY